MYVFKLSYNSIYFLLFVYSFILSMFKFLILWFTTYAQIHSIVTLMGTIALPQHILSGSASHTVTCSPHP